MPRGAVIGAAAHDHHFVDAIVLPPIAGEFPSRMNCDRHPIAGVALTTDTSMLEVRRPKTRGDIPVARSTSGRSPISR